MKPDYNTGHPASVALPKGLSFREPVLMQEVPGGTTRPIINQSEAQFFKQHGYVIKRDLLVNKQQLSKAVDHLWAKVPREILKRDEPASWIDSPSTHWTEQDHEQVGLLMGTNWKIRSRGNQGIGTERFLVDEIANHPVMLSVAESFLGQSIKPVNRVRGIYAVFPQPEGVPGRLGPHGDYMASMLSAMVLVSDVKPNCGGFTVWPGSHRHLHTQWDTVHGSRITGARVAGYEQTRNEVLANTVPAEFTGSCGDVVFWHPRLIHSAGVNRSFDAGEPVVRVVVPVDYQSNGQKYVDDLEYGPGPIYQWWVDTRNFEEDKRSTAENIWDSWSI